MLESLVYLLSVSIKYTVQINNELEIIITFAESIWFDDCSEQHFVMFFSARLTFYYYYFLITNSEVDTKCN